VPARVVKVPVDVLVVIVSLPKEARLLFPIIPPFVEAEGLAI
jgi:hypothetical protein